MTPQEVRHIHAASTRAEGPVRVLVLDNEFDMGGSEKKLFDYILRVDRARVEVIVCCLKRGGYLAGRLEEAGVRVVTGFQRRRFDPAAPARFLRWLRDVRPDVIYTMAHPNTVLLSWAAAARGRTGAWVVSFHAMGRADGGRLVPSWLKPFLVQADRLLAVADMHRDYLRRREGLPADRIDVIHNGVDTTRYRPAEPGERRAARAELGIDANAVTVTHVASIKPLKRQDALVRAMAPLMQSRADVHLVFAGDGPMREHCERLARHLGIADRTHFLGIREDVERVFHASDVIALPSRTEVFPNVVLEAMAAGVPVVATDVGCVREMVADGETAILVDEGDDAALAEALTRLVRDAELRARFGAAARERVTRHFPIERMCDARTRLFERLRAGA